LASLLAMLCLPSGPRVALTRAVLCPRLRVTRSRATARPAPAAQTCAHNGPRTSHATTPPQAPQHAHPHPHPPGGAPPHAELAPSISPHYSTNALGEGAFMRGFMRVAGLDPGIWGALGGCLCGGVCVFAGKWAGEGGCVA